MGKKTALLFLCILVLFDSSCGYQIGDLSHNDFKTESDTESKIFSVIPNEYIEIIESYKQLVADVFSQEFEEKVNNGYFDIIEDQELSYDWFCMVIDAKKGLDEISSASFGISICDLDGDKIEELILLREDYYVLAVYTLELSHAKLLGAYSYKNRATILENGRIYNLISEAANSFEIRLLELKKGELVTIELYGSYIDPNTNRGYYYLLKDGMREEISEEEFKKLSLNYAAVFENEEAKANMQKAGIDFLSIMAD